MHTLCLSHLRNTCDLSLGAEALASPKGLLEMKKTTPDLHRNQIPSEKHVNSREALISGLTSLCLSFLFRIMGIITEPIYEVGVV